MNILCVYIYIYIYIYIGGRPAPSSRASLRSRFASSTARGRREPWPMHMIWYDMIYYIWYDMIFIHGVGSRTQASVRLSAHALARSSARPRLRIPLPLPFHTIPIHMPIPMPIPSLSLSLLLCHTMPCYTVRYCTVLVLGRRL